MIIEIKDRFSGRVIFSGEYSTIRDCVIAAVTSRADLSSANLRYANLRSANLSSANLSSANLSSANLSYANLRSADLSSANLSSANLRYANLSYANLRSADLSSANLRSANLRSADLSSADLSSAKNAETAVAQTIITPEGDLIGWKKCRGNIVVKIRVPSDARRSNAMGRKCRAEFVDVVEVFGADVGISHHNDQIKYVVGRRVHCHKWDEDRWVECGGGIHFFLTRVEAENY